MPLGQIEGSGVKMITLDIALQKLLISYMFVRICDAADDFTLSAVFVAVILSSS